MLLLLAVGKHAQVRVKTWVLTGDPHPQISCGPLWSNRGSPDYVSPPGRLLTHRLLPQPCSLSTCVSLCHRPPPLTLSCPGTLALVLARSCLSASLTCPCVCPRTFYLGFWWQPLFLPLSPSLLPPALPPVTFLCTREGLCVPGLCAEPAHLQKLGVRALAGVEGTQAAFFQRKGRWKSEAREGPSCLFPPVQ